MDRRKFLVGMGSLAAGGAAVMGTGAFTSVKADRSITVQTAGDASAYLKLEPQPSSPNANAHVETNPNGTIKINVADTSAGGSGVNKNAYTVIRDLIKITNQGTQGVIFGHRQDFAPQTVFAFHDDPRYKPGGSKLQAGETNLVNAGNPDNSGTNVESIATKNLPYIQTGEALNNFGIGVGIQDSNPALSGGTITFIAAADPSEDPDL
jgi:hypothetical protein